MVIFTLGRDAEHRALISQRMKRFHTNAGKLIVTLGLLTASAGILEFESQTIPHGIAWAASLTCFVPMLL